MCTPSGTAKAVAAVAPHVATAVLEELFLQKKLYNLSNKTGFYFVTGSIARNKYLVMVT